MTTTRFRQPMPISSASKLMEFAQDAQRELAGQPRRQRRGAAWSKWRQTWRSNGRSFQEVWKRLNA